MTCFICGREAWEVAVVSIMCGMGGRDVEDTAHALCDGCQGGMGAVFQAAMDEWARVWSENQAQSEGQPPENP